MRRLFDLMGLEDRATDRMRLAKFSLGAVFAAVAILGFVAPLLTRVNMTGVYVGQVVTHPVFGRGVVDTVNPMEGTVFVEFPETRVVLRIEDL